MHFTVLKSEVNDGVVLRGNVMNASSIAYNMTMCSIDYVAISVKASMMQFMEL